MNWQTIREYAAALFVAQAAVGFLEGFLFSPSVAVLFGSAAASFVICGAIFVHLGAHQLRKPFLHAWGALLLQVIAASVLAQILALWVGSRPVPLIVLELVVLVCALATGTSIGVSRRRILRQPADA